MSKSLKMFTISTFSILCIILCGCGVIDVTGKTFAYGGVSINWNNVSDDVKAEIFDIYQVGNEIELKVVLKTAGGRNSRLTTFGTDGKYITKDSLGNILDSGYYEQSEGYIALADTIEELNSEKVYKIYPNEKGYKVRIEIDGEKGIYAEYQYVEIT